MSGVSELPRLQIPVPQPSRNISGQLSPKQPRVFFPRLCITNTTLHLVRKSGIVEERLVSDGKKTLPPSANLSRIAGWLRQVTISLAVGRFGVLEKARAEKQGEALLICDCYLPGHEPHKAKLPSVNSSRKSTPDGNTDASNVTFAIIEEVLEGALRPREVARLLCEE